MKKRGPLKQGDNTPWGSADHVTEIAPGIWSVQTPGHGGIYLEPHRAIKIPPALVSLTWLKESQWYEEDCDWCIPFVYFEDTIREHGSERDRAIIEKGIARACLKDVHPEWTIIEPETEPEQPALTGPEIRHVKRVLQGELFGSDTPYNLAG